MVYKDPHLSDQELLLAADGELSAGRQEEVRRHLQACWTCRSRMGELEHVVAGFVDSYHSLLDARVPPDDCAAALLRANLRAAAMKQGKRSFTWTPTFRWGWPAWIACAMAVASLTGVLLWKQHGGQVNMEGDLVPNPALTPGETVAISKNEVCRQTNNFPENEAVPEATREAVFSAYGMKDAPKNAYEIDFLITPSLGGSSSIRNLWPEPYHRSDWNAYRKDVLEERLHSLVCNGELDLSTAQREIASNWIGAYKKYVDGK